jgi:hypothetical protein
VPKLIGAGVAHVMVGVIALVEELLLLLPQPVTKMDAMNAKESKIRVVMFSPPDCFKP